MSSWVFVILGLGNGLLLDGVKPSSDPLSTCCWLDSQNIFQWDGIQNLNISIQENAFENVICKMLAIMSIPLCVKKISHLQHVYGVGTNEILSPLLQL